MQPWPNLSTALSCENILNHHLLVGPQGVNGARKRGDVVAQQEGRTAPLIIPQVGSMLSIARQTRQLDAESPGDFRRIGKPEIFIGLEPSERITEYDCSSRSRADICAGTVKGGTPENRLLIREGIQL